MKSIDEKIQRLGREEQEEFNERVDNLLYDRLLCRRNGINYVHPDRQKAKEAIYREMFENLK